MNKEIEIVKLMENKQQHRKSRKHMEEVETSLFVCLLTVVPEKRATATETALVPKRKQVEKLERERDRKGEREREKGAERTLRSVCFVLSC
jgi:hypothetical protein